MKTLETKNLELKYTNKNLISTLSEQKEMLKTLKTKISTLESSKDTLNDYEKLLEEHKDLMIKYNKSLEEISKLKELIPKYKSDNGLFGSFLKRNNLDDDKTVNDNVENKQKK